MITLKKNIKQIDNYSETLSEKFLKILEEVELDFIIKIQDDQHSINLLLAQGTNNDSFGT